MAKHKRQMLQVDESLHPLHAHVLLQWAQTLRQQTQWHLPKELEMLPPASELSIWKLQLLLLPPGVLAFYLMAVHGMLLIFLLYLAGVLAYAVALWLKGKKQAAITRLNMGQPYQGQKSWKGSVVDVAAGAVQSLGQQPAWQANIRDGQSWSVGVHVVGGRHIVCYLLELRHARKGPVGVLCTLHTSATPAPDDLRAMDALIDTIAECLSLRRSGARLQRIKHRQ